MIGLVGVGLLGQALASRFVAAGLSVIGWDVHPGARQALGELGGHIAESAADALGCRRVVLCLPDDGIVAAAIGPRAARGAARKLVLLRFLRAP